MINQNFKKLSDSFIIDTNYEEGLNILGLTSIEDIFSFSGGRDLSKSNLAGYRTRLQFEIPSQEKTLFLKRFNKPPILAQLKNWIAAAGRKSCASFDFEIANELSARGINTARTVAFGEQFGKIFEKRSFCITEKIADAESLERRIPACFFEPVNSDNLKKRKDFINKLAQFVKKFHTTGYRHRDLYLSHIFYNNRGEFYLIDLARAFKPLLFVERYRIKDIAQLYYSAPGKYFSTIDRLRFYFGLTGRKQLNKKDKAFITKVIKKAEQIARHDKKHGRKAPFEN